MNINGRLNRLERAFNLGRKAAVFLILPAGATEADEEHAKAVKLRELGLSPLQITAWLIVKGLSPQLDH